MKVGTLIILFVFSFNIYSQSQRKMSGSASQGSLTVTATVVPSVWLVMEPNGKQEVIVANAPDSKESFSRPANTKTKSSVRSKQPAKASPAVVQENYSGKGEVAYGIPSGTKQFETIQQTKIMNVTDGGKTTQQPVRVTTVISQ